MSAASDHSGPLPARVLVVRHTLSMSDEACLAQLRGALGKSDEQIVDELLEFLFARVRAGVPFQGSLIASLTAVDSKANAFIERTQRALTVSEKATADAMAVTRVAESIFAPLRDLTGTQSE